MAPVAVAPPDRIDEVGAGAEAPDLALSEARRAARLGLPAPEVCRLLHPVVLALNRQRVPPVTRLARIHPEGGTLACASGFTRTRTVRVGMRATAASLDLVVPSLREHALSELTRQVSAGGGARGRQGPPAAAACARGGWLVAAPRGAD